MKQALSGVLLLATFWAKIAAAQSAPAEPPSQPEAIANAATPEPPSPTTADRARELGREGLRAYGESDFELALDRFTRAEALVHSPVFQLYSARCLSQLGRGDDARRLLEDIAGTSMPESAPEAWHRAQRAAEAELTMLANPVAHGTQEPDGLPADFDADGHTRAEVSGQPRMPSWHPQPPTPQGFWQQRTANERGALVAFGVGTVALVFTVVSGGMAVAEAAAVRENCVGTSCRPEDLPRAEYAERLANLATAGGITTMAAITTGTVLWLLPAPASSVSVGLRRYGTGLALVGTF